jgi:LDH2 family malate/lactate/ureidoglycolate dehydrogenase
MTVSEIRNIVEEVLLDRGLDDEEAVETTDAIIEALHNEGVLDDYYEDPSDENAFFD